MSRRLHFVEDKEAEQQRRALYSHLLLSWKRSELGGRELWGHVLRSQHDKGLSVFSSEPLLRSALISAAICSHLSRFFNSDLSQPLTEPVLSMKAYLNAFMLGYGG